MAENGASQIIKIKSDNTLQRVGGFRSVGWITVDPRDGSCWVSDVGAYKVFKLSADGGQKIEINLGYHQPLYSALDSRDGSCWVAYGGPNIVVKFDSSGAPKANIGIHYPFSMAVSPLDGSLWFAVHDNTIKFDSEGKTLFTVPVHEHSVSANIPDGSCWIGFTKVSSNGTVLKSIRTKFHAYCNIALIERATNIEEAP
jgi:DNA-binding beta-propeller fold protein YncE